MAGTEIARRETAVARRKVIAGTVVRTSEGGPAGAALSVATAARERRKTVKAASSSPAKAMPAGEQTPPAQKDRAKRKPAKRKTPDERTNRGKRVYATLTGRASGGLLLAEYLIGAFLITLIVFTDGPEKGYLETMASVQIRLTAFTMVFFILFLISGSPEAGKAAAWFGLLIDLGIIFTAVRKSEISLLANIIRGEPTGVDQATLTKSTTVNEPEPESLPQ